MLMQVSNFWPEHHLKQSKMLSVYSSDRRLPIGHRSLKTSAFTSLHQLTQVQNRNNTSWPLWNIFKFTGGRSATDTVSAKLKHWLKNLCKVAKSLPWSWPAHHIVLSSLFKFSEGGVFVFSLAPSPIGFILLFLLLFKKYKHVKNGPSKHSVPFVPEVWS